MEKAEVSKDDVKQMIVKSFPEKGGELFMTPAQELRLEGKAEGELLGEIKSLEKLFDEKLINEEVYKSKIEPLKAKLKEFKGK